MGSHLREPRSVSKDQALRVLDPGGWTREEKVFVLGVRGHVQSRLVLWHLRRSRLYFTRGKNWVLTPLLRLSHLRRQGFQSLDVVNKTR